jgi:predicted transcriptional regulator
MREEIALSDLFKAMADKNSLDIFDIISVSNMDSQKLMSTVALSKRQYYDRISDLRKAGLIERHRGRYDITSFGMIIHSLLKVIEKATTRYWRLQAVDMLKFSSISREDYDKMIDTLLDDFEIKQILLNSMQGMSTSSRPSSVLQSSQQSPIASF